MKTGSHEGAFIKSRASAVLCSSRSFGGGAKARIIDTDGSRCQTVSKIAGASRRATARIITNGKPTAVTEPLCTQTEQLSVRLTLTSGTPIQRDGLESSDFAPLSGLTPVDSKSYKRRTNEQARASLHAKLLAALRTHLNRRTQSCSPRRPAHGSPWPRPRRAQPSPP